MDGTNPLPFKIEVHSVISFSQKKTTPVDIHRRLCAVYGTANVLSVHSMEIWQRAFKEGRTNVEDEDQEG